MSGVRRLVVLLGGLVIAGVLSASAVATKHPRLQHVTIFGDSSASALSWDPPALQQITKYNRVTLELQPCGRLATPGCWNPPPPSVLKEVRTLGPKIGPNVIVLVGYNDDAHAYLDGIDKVLHAMRKNGVQHVLWLTLRVQAHPGQYRGINTVIHGAAHRSPIMWAINWAGYSGPHPEWFTDGIHFTGSGAVQFGLYLHRQLHKFGLSGPKTSG